MALVCNFDSHGEPGGEYGSIDEYRADPEHSGPYSQVTSQSLSL